MRVPSLAAAALLASLLAAQAGAQDPFAGQPAGDQPKGDTDESTPDYMKAVELQRKGKWKEAQKAFQEVMKKYPNSVHAEDCELRGGENCYMGCVKLWESGPPSRRIDVTMMGDGFTIDPKDQKLEEEWAGEYVEKLCTELSYREYKSYFNYYYVRLVSKDTGVDEVLSDEELKKRQEKLKNKSAQARKKGTGKTDFKTAIDCKSAGPQKQVLADRDLVYQWLEYANKEVVGCGDDGLVFAFARFGKLGMGGGGIANVGPPDASVDVHEFGHAFCGLLDEYANNPGPPGYPIRAPNATSNKNDIPWQHFLDKKVSDVGVFEGGATYQKEVWRPARACAMNSAGNAGGYCPVCREQAVLSIYRYVNPIDKVSQNPQMELRVVEGDASQIVVTPMQPVSHDLECVWYVDRAMDSDPGPVKAADGTTSDGSAEFDAGFNNGMRAYRRDGELYNYPPSGQLSQLGHKEERSKSSPAKFVFPVGKLPKGRWVITCKVWDPTTWVLKDPQHLLEERETFWVTVGAKK